MPRLYAELLAYDVPQVALDPARIAAFVRAARFAGSSSLATKEEVA